MKTAADWVDEVVKALDGSRSWIDPEIKPDGSYKILRQSNVATKDPMKPTWAL
jgi:hypothetical protein